MARYEKARPADHVCRECGAISEVRVEVDTQTGDAGWTCPECLTTQPPNRHTEGDDRGVGQ